MSIQSLRKAPFALCLLAAGLFAAENPFVGTWNLNGAKSKLTGSGIGSKGTVHIEANDASLKFTVESTDEKGEARNFNYEAALDGKAATISGTATVDEVSLKRVDDHTIDATGKKDGKVVYTDKRTVSQDGKTMTIVRSGKNPEGKAFHATIVFDRQ